MNDHFDYDEFVRIIKESLAEQTHDECEQPVQPMNLFNGFMMTPRVLSKEEIEFNRKHG